MSSKINILTTKYIIGIFILIALSSCSTREDKYFSRAREDFAKYEIPYIKQNWSTYISYAFKLKKDEGKTNEGIAREFWKKIDPEAQKFFERMTKMPTATKSSHGLKIPDKWEFWGDILEAPERYIARTSNGDIFLEHEIETFNSGWSFSMYSFAIIEMTFAKDDRLCWFKMFFLYSPEHGWKPVEFEFSWPSTLTLHDLKKGKTSGQ